MEKDNIAYCGLDCSKCECYIATVNNDDELRKKIAKEWGELNHCEIPYQAMNCLGCKQDGIKSTYCEQMCLVRKCCLNNKLTLCTQCNKFKNCEKVAPYLKSENNTFNK